MATPIYRGSGQTIADNGGSWFGRLGSFFGVGTPQYVGNGQPGLTSRSFFGGNTPPYAPAPAAPVTTETCTVCPVDPEAIAQGQIAIVIPTQG
jgi:hypothetical protein